jgi:SAM-dependent methyltransferase
VIYKDDGMKILDATCGIKGIWHQKDHPFVTFMDKRYINGKMQKTKNKISNRRVIRITPDLIARWEHLPFRDHTFDLVVFDPPHFIKNKMPDSFFYEKYDMLSPKTWRQVLRSAFDELFRVLKPEGIFIFKWNECYRSVKDVLPLIPYRPMFGTQVGKNHNTHWILFIKHRLEKQLELT